MKGDKPLRLGDYEIHRAWEGFSSIRQISSGEIMHSRTDPMEEARELYVEQSRLAERLRESSIEPLILYGATAATCVADAYRIGAGMSLKETVVPLSSVPIEPAFS